MFTLPGLVVKSVLAGSYGWVHSRKFLAVECLYLTLVHRLLPLAWIRGYREGGTKF